MLTIIENAEIFSPDALGIGCVVMGGGKILFVGRDIPEISPDLVTEKIDLHERKLIPGLIDGHVHSTGGGGEDGFSSQVPAVQLSQFTRHGVTSVVGLLGTDDETRSTTNLLARTRALREEGLSAWCWTGGYHVPLTTLTGSVRKDIVNIDCVIGVGELAISDHRSSQPSMDELARIASEAYTAGMISGKAGVIHLHLGDGERGLDMVQDLIEQTELPARIFHPTHANRRKALFDQACELSRKGVTIDLTAFPAAQGGAQLENAQSEDEISAANAWVLFRDRNCPVDKITVSSDSGGCLPNFDQNQNLISMGIGSSSTLLDFVRELLNAGHGLAEVLPCVTSNVASLLKLPGKGRIETGFDADLVCLDEANRVQHVFAGGRCMVRDGAPVIKGQFEE